MRAPATHPPSLRSRIRGRAATARLLLFASLALWLLSAEASAEMITSGGRRADRASEIEQRLLAPCCWTQTLDVHDSELSSALRLEIRGRLMQGQAPAAIEDELAQRYGERIRAVPAGSDLRSAAPVLVGTAMVLSLFALLAWVRRGRARSLASLAALEAGDLESDYDAELERELAKLDSLTPGAANRRRI
jgi:cytochrome c-type biogenesis protein CcmH